MLNEERKCQIRPKETVSSQKRNIITIKLDPLRHFMSLKTLRRSFKCKIYTVNTTFGCVKVDFEQFPEGFAFPPLIQVHPLTWSQVCPPSHQYQYAIFFCKVRSGSAAVKCPDVAVEVQDEAVSAVQG